MPGTGFALHGRANPSVLVDGLIRLEAGPQLIETTAQHAEPDPNRGTRGVARLLPNGKAGRKEGDEKRFGGGAV